jgi:hypothetical protein
LCLWLPSPEPGAGGEVDTTKAIEKAVTRIRDFEAFCLDEPWTAQLVVAVPAALGRGVEQLLETALVGRIEPEFRRRFVLRSYGPGSLEEAAAARERYALPDAHQAWLLFVDSAGVLRAAETFYANKAMDAAFLQWIEVFRNR